MLLTSDFRAAVTLKERCCEVNCVVMFSAFSTPHCEVTQQRLPVIGRQLYMKGTALEHLAGLCKLSLYSKESLSL